MFYDSLDSLLVSINFLLFSFSGSCIFESLLHCLRLSPKIIFFLNSFCPFLKVLEWSECFLLKKFKNSSLLRSWNSCLNLFYFLPLIPVCSPNKTVSDDRWYKPGLGYYFSPKYLSFLVEVLFLCSYWVSIFLEGVSRILPIFSSLLCLLLSPWFLLEGRRTGGTSVLKLGQICREMELELELWFASIASIYRRINFFLINSHI